jgi:hypothetical protein
MAAAVIAAGSELPDIKLLSITCRGVYKRPRASQPVSPRLTPNQSPCQLESASTRQLQLPPPCRTFKSSGQRGCVGVPTLRG